MRELQGTEKQIRWAEKILDKIEENKIAAAASIVKIKWLPDETKANKKELERISKKITEYNTEDVKSAAFIINRGSFITKKCNERELLRQIAIYCIEDIYSTDGDKDLRYIGY